MAPLPWHGCSGKCKVSRIKIRKLRWLRHRHGVFFAETFAVSTNVTLPMCKQCSSQQVASVHQPPFRYMTHSFSSDQKKKKKMRYHSASIFCPLILQKSCETCKKIPRLFTYWPPMTACFAVKRVQSQTSVGDMIELWILKWSESLVNSYYCWWKKSGEPPMKSIEILWKMRYSHIFSISTCISSINSITPRCFKKISPKNIPNSIGES